MRKLIIVMKDIEKFFIFIYMVCKNFKKQVKKLMERRAKAKKLKKKKVIYKKVVYNI